MVSTSNPRAPPQGIPSHLPSEGLNLEISKGPSFQPQASVSQLWKKQGLDFELFETEKLGCFLLHLQHASCGWVTGLWVRMGLGQQHPPPPPEQEFEPTHFGRQTA